MVRDNVTGGKRIRAMICFKSEELISFGLFMA